MGQDKIFVSSNMGMRIYSGGELSKFHLHFHNELRKTLDMISANKIKSCNHLWRLVENTWLIQIKFGLSNSDLDTKKNLRCVEIFKCTCFLQFILIVVLHIISPPSLFEIEALT